MDPAMLPPDALSMDWNGMPYMIACGVAISVIVMVNALRVVGQLRISREQRLKMDDWMMLVGSVMTMAYVIIMIVSYKNGAGNHIYVLTAEQLRIYSITVYASTPLFNIGILLVKLSVLVTFWNIFGVSVTMRRFIIGIGAVTSAGIIGVTASMMFPCRPVAKAIFPQMDGKCIPLVPNYFVQAGFMVASDLAIYILPIPMVIKLHLRTAQKAAIIGLFALGGLACIAGIVKLCMMPSLLSNPDISYNATTSLVWLNVELTASVVAGSGPALKSIARSWFPDWFDASTNGSGSGGNDSSLVSRWMRSIERRDEVFRAIESPSYELEEYREEG